MKRSIIAGAGAVVALGFLAASAVANYLFGAEIENAIGSAYNDKIIGNELSNKLEGGDGDDNVFGDTTGLAAAGQSTLGIKGEQYLELAPNAQSLDTMIGGLGSDSLYGGAGGDFLFGANSSGAEFAANYTARIADGSKWADDWIPFSGALAEPPRRACGRIGRVRPWRFTLDSVSTLRNSERMMRGC